MRRLKLFMKRAAVVLVSSALAWLAAEILFAKLRPSYTVGIGDSYEYDEELAFRLRPGAHLYRTTDFLQESRANALGTANFQEGFDGYERLVFAVGDSYTQGTGVAADQSYPFQLDLTLNRDAEGFYVKKYGVVNLGLAGYGGEQNLIALRRGVERLGRPAVVLYMGTDNDFEDDLIFRAGERHRNWNGVLPRWFWNDTQTGVKLRRLVLGRRRAALRDEALARANLTNNPPPVAELERPTLEALAERARADGALLVVSWSDAGRSYDWLKAWAGERGILFADWAARAKSVTDAMPNLPLDNRHTGGHPRAWTNRVIAEEFARQIRLGGK
ncbi:MAG TPA: SGNH/GDSL hydrolase family protein [Pyrinomonadaceae bacterium]|nr:SGNH/GDSL hydrolase family protein [Pyrinomonadaceae bacterium]